MEKPKWAQTRLGRGRSIVSAASLQPTNRLHLVQVTERESLENTIAQIKYAWMGLFLMQIIQNGGLREIKWYLYKALGSG